MFAIGGGLVRLGPMMATFHEGVGSIFDADVEALVNPVNCVGVMGKGLALEFAKRFRWAAESYRDACSKGWLQPGQVLYCIHVGIRNTKRIIHFPTKRHWRNPSTTEDVIAGLDNLAFRISVGDIPVKSIAIPALGCGLGGLDWSVVRPMILAALEPIDGLDVWLYGPDAHKVVG